VAARFGRRFALAEGFRMTSPFGKFLSAAALAAALAFGCTLAVAQDKQEKKAPAAKTEVKKKTTDTPSPCKGLDETACKDKATDCSWIGASKREGKDVKAYCRKKKSTAKKTESKKTDTKKTDTK
jgi:hypothetical protein